MADFGYDVADYRDVDPIFGDMADLDALIEAAHQRGMRVLLDYVPNHTSSEHPWFTESRSSRENAKRDWYLWVDAKPDGSPPNNWLSFFGSPAWTWDAKTSQFYCHSFLNEQPDLNWRNPVVRAAMYDVLRFWLDRGIDGFRVDVLWLLIKDDQLRDNPANPDWKQGEGLTYESLLPLYTADRPEIHDIVADMRAVTDEYDDRVLMGEIYLPVDRLVTYYGSRTERLGAHLPFNFQLLLLPWQAEVIGTAIMEYEQALPAHGWPNWVLGNHDTPRICSRVGAAQARVAAMLLLTLRGTPTLYYGDEIGMTDAEIPAKLQQDPARFAGADGGRDPQRTPMRWDATARAGFTDGTPWLPVGPDVAGASVASQRDDPESMLSLYRSLIDLRRSDEALSIGTWSPIVARGDLLAYERSTAGRRLVVVLNFGPAGASFQSPTIGRGKILVSTRMDRAGEAVLGTLRIRGDEGVLIDASDLGGASGR